MPPSRKHLPTKPKNQIKVQKPKEAVLKEVHGTITYRTSRLGSESCVEEVGDVTCPLEFSAIYSTSGFPKAQNPVHHFKWNTYQVSQVFTHVSDRCGGQPSTLTYKNVAYAFPAEQLLDTGYKLLRASYINPSKQDVRARVENPFGNEFFESLVQIKELGRFLVDIRGGLNRLRFAPRAVKRALASQKPKHVKHGLTTRRTKQLAADAGNAYLSYSFGWRQTGDDVARLIAFMRDAKANLRNLMSGKVHKQDYSFKKDEGSLLEPNHAFSGPYYISWYTEKVTKWYITYVVEPLGSYLAGFTELFTWAEKLGEFWGLRPSVRRAYNAFPLSWIADMIFPIDDLLEDVDGGWRMSYRLKVTSWAGTASCKHVYRVRGPGNPFHDARWQPSGLDGEWWGEQYTRIVLRRPPNFSISERSFRTLPQALIVGANKNKNRLGN